LITAYVRAEGSLRAHPLAPGEPLPAGLIWLDVLRPDEVERAEISQALGVDLPTREDMSEIEASSRLYVEEGSAFLTTPVIYRSESGQQELGLITFVLTGDMTRTGVLITVRHAEPLWFAIFAARALRHASLVTTPMEAWLGLLEAVVDRAADVLEGIGATLDSLSTRIFAHSAEHHDSSHPHRRAAGKPRRTVRRKPVAKGLDGLQQVIGAIGIAGDQTHKVRDCLAGLERLCAFAVTVAGQHLSKDQKVRLKTIARDVNSLVQHAAFQAHQTSFLLDATLGVINIQQTNIIKIFSVAAVAFLPPTLIASIYGMNFQHMPELSESWGYPLALCLMLLSAIVPLLYFKRRGWL